MSYQRDNVADELLSQGADLQAQDSQGNTVLHYAAGRLRRGKGGLRDCCMCCARDRILLKYAPWTTDKGQLGPYVFNLGAFETHSSDLVLRIRPDVLLIELQL